jgi:subtilisin family serine protease
LDLVRLTPLMALTSGSPEIAVGLIDGPVATDRVGLGAKIRELSGSRERARSEDDGTARLHGTFVAGILGAERGSLAPAICPGCTLLVRPVFTGPADALMPSTTPEELASAIVECVEAGARVINRSLALERPSAKGERELAGALDHAAARNVVIVAAAGNEGVVGSSAITRHPWIIPVVSYDLEGRPMDHSNLGSSIGRRGLGAPGAKVTSLGVNGEPRTLTGTSVAAPFVTGAIALLWSTFPTAPSAKIRFAITQASGPRRTSVVPPLLDAWTAYQSMLPMQMSGTGR